MMSHMGKPKGKVKPELSLSQIVKNVSDALGVDVKFAKDCGNADAEAAALKPGEALLLENLRFYPEEEGKPVGVEKGTPEFDAAKAEMKERQKKFAAKLASYADVYVMDAFGTAHRKHASTAVIADSFDKDHKMLGFLMEKEVKAVDAVLGNIKRPFTAIMGGSKVSTKIGIIENLLTKVDNLILCGGMTYTFSKALGGKIGMSICEDDTRSEQGVIYFGSAQGLCCFLPRQVLSVNRAPKTIITSLRLIRGIEQTDSVINLAIRNHISLAYDENSFAINFTVKNFAMENYVEYSYMLSGLQNDWITAQNGTITLRDIPSGTYQLQVRARFHNQPWSSEIAEFTIIVRPPFWLSWWAKLCYTLFVLAIVYLALRIYQRHLRLKFELKAEKVNHEKEQKLNEERLRFFTNITHELRTPLTLILGPLDDISHSSDITKAVKHKLAVIYQSAVRLNELITQILEFRKTETDNRQLRVVKANVVDAVHEVSLKYEELAQKPDVAIKFVAPENPIMMYIDKEVIAIILDNLVSNAIKYTDQGNIDISVERRRSGERHLVDITVSDTGHGISATALPHIFDRYYQENGPHQASGTGIGLSLVKKLVTLHHGEVKVESNLEQGTSFIVTLDENEIYPDALRGDENASAKLQGNDTAFGVLNLEEAVLSVENGKPLLLVVEDNREILDYVAESFIDEFDVLKAGDGRDGLALALNKVPDVIISDVMMPNMDGNAMCRALKKDIRTSHIPIILLTAKDSFEAKEKGYDSGADSYITKPFTHLLLRSRILNLLQQRRRDKMLIQESKETNLARKKEQLRESLNKVDQEFFDKLNKLIEENISGDVDVNLIASNLAVSTSTLYRKMKALTGISTNEYIRKYKMQYAEHLLLEGKYSISEISFMVGMNSVAYFRRCFKAEYGEIPSEYLKKLQKM